MTTAAIAPDDVTAPLPRFVTDVALDARRGLDRAAELVGLVCLLYWLTFAAIAVVEDLRPLGVLIYTLTLPTGATP